MEKKIVKLNGTFFISKANSEEEFVELMDAGLIGGNVLEKAFFIETDSEAAFEFKCDIPGQKDYIKAFVYEDDKVLGNYHFLTLQGDELVELNARFISYDTIQEGASVEGDEGAEKEKGAYMILGSLYQKDVRYFFELDLYKMDNETKD